VGIQHARCYSPALVSPTQTTRVFALQIFMNMNIT
jgi:hypothetical protein